MALRNLLIAAALVTGTAGRSSDWQPVPSEVWAIKEGPKGALVLEDRTRFSELLMESTYRVRIFSEEGRAAAELPDLPGSAVNIHGRTIYPDGRQVEFNSLKDFAERKAETGIGQWKAIHLVAPGVTGDCVVEVRWSERTDKHRGGLPGRFHGGLYGQFRLGNRFPTKVATVEVMKPYSLAINISSSSWARTEEKETGHSKTISFHNLPAQENVPYSAGLNNGFPELTIYWQPYDLRNFAMQGPDVYWPEVSKEIYRNHFESDVHKGSPFRKVAMEILEKLPEEPAKKAAEILTRLEERVRNLDQATHQENGNLPTGFWGEFNLNHLDKAMKTGLSNSRGMKKLFYHLLKEAGLSVRIGKVVDQYRSSFRYKLLNPWQFDDELIGVELPGKELAWFDPGLRYATPGVISPDYQGTSALVINSVNWKPERMVIPVSSADQNLSSYRYDLTLEEEAVRFSVKSQFNGYPEYMERRHYLPMEVEEQSRSLKARFEKALKNAIVEKSDVLFVGDPRKRVEWKVSGILEREASRFRGVAPFPGMPIPLRVPERLETRREVPIILPGQSIQLAESFFILPKGYSLDSQNEIRRENEFGKVNWTLSYDEATRQARVVFRSEVTVLTSSASHWEAFKVFLEWIQEAVNRQVILSRLN